jgi:hypothetical protein
MRRRGTNGSDRSTAFKAGELEDVPWARLLPEMW